MGVTVQIPAPLRPLTSGRTSVELAASPATVEEALAALWRLYPGLRDRVLTEQGQVRLHVNVFVDMESIRHTGGLATPLQGGEEIAIIPAISGG